MNCQVIRREGGIIHCRQREYPPPFSYMLYLLCFVSFTGHFPVERFFQHAVTLTVTGQRIHL